LLPRNLVNARDGPNLVLPTADVRQVIDELRDALEGHLPCSPRLLAEAEHCKLWPHASLLVGTLKHEPQPVCQSFSDEAPARQSEALLAVDADDRFDGLTRRDVVASLKIDVHESCTPNSWRRGGS
jgi:hypothetical protein